MKKLFAAAAVLAALSGGAHAQFYVSGGVGATRANVDCSGTTSCDKSDVGYKLVGGYQVNPAFAAELSYFDFGKVKASVNVPPLVNVDLAARGFAVGAAFRGELTQGLQGVARLGVANLSTKVSASAGGFTASDSQTNASLYYGVGLTYSLSKQLSLDGAADFSRAEYDGEKANVRMLSVGITYRF